MNAISETALGNPAGPVNQKPLWAAVGILGAVVVALAATLAYVQGQRAGSEPVAAMGGTAKNTGEPTTAVASRLLADSVDSKAGESIVQQDEVSKPPSGLVKQAQTAPKNAATKPETSKPAPRAPVAVAQAPATSSSPAGVGGGVGASGAGGASGAVPAAATPAPAAVSVPKAICTSCGTVVAATPVQQNAPGSGVGMVAGGVVGGVLGNQVGGGSGKTAATILGALGGGWAGNEVEKRMKKVTVYDTSVQMENGSTRNFSLAHPVSAGARVTVEGTSLRLADGSLVSPLPAPPPRPQVRSTTNDPNQPGG
jgi:outer membrane lipoprotein SlyB